MVNDLDGRLPSHSDLVDLVEWKPSLGTVSVYLDIDPADRGEGWRIVLEHGLKALVDDARDRGEAELRRALEPTAKRILEKFEAELPRPPGRTQVGFVEVDQRAGREAWFAAQVAAPHTGVWLRERPHVEPLVELLHDGGPVGIVAVSSELVRIWEWHLGLVSELESFELELTSPVWRERKAQVSPDTARVHGAKASGRDQHEQRLDANRERFLHDIGRRLGPLADERGWRELLVFSERNYGEVILEAADGDRLRSRLLEDANVLNEGAEQIRERVEEMLDELNRARELELVRRIRDEGLSTQGQASLGVQETLRALEQGQVRHLALAPEVLERTHRADAVATLLPEAIELALRTGAEVTPVEGEAADLLAQHEGAGALLRY
jgi:Bacterial archaeo-eukaryotic release factor family 5